MKFEYNPDVDAAYIYLKYPMKEGECKKTEELNKENIVLDLDGSGKIIGVEILNASKVLSKKVMEEAIV